MNMEITRETLTQNNTSLEYSNIQERMNAPVSFVKGAKSNKILRTGSLIEVFQAMKTNGELKLFSERLRSLKLNNDPQYSRLKENECPGFIFGKYANSIRNDKNIIVYVPLLGFDIDKADDFFHVKSILAMCKTSPYIFMAFPSPSMLGVRIFIWCNSSIETHKQYYSKVCKHLSKVLSIPTSKSLRSELKNKGYNRIQIQEYFSRNVHIDESTSNTSRIWFYTQNLEEDIYMDAESEVFSVAIQSETDLKPPTITPSLKVKKTYSDSDVLEHLDKFTNSSYGRNVRMHTLACKFFENSFTENEIYNYLKKYLEPYHPIDPFDEGELWKIVRKAKNQIIQKGKINMYSREQMYSYITKRILDEK